MSQQDWEELNNFRNIQSQGRALDADLNAFLFRIVAQYLDKIEKNKGSILNKSSQPRTIIDTLIKDIALAPSKSRHTLDYCARQCGLSTSVYKVKIKRITQTSHTRYVEKKCMEKAKQLITMHHKPIHEVALQLGYSYSTNFSRAYKKFWGVYPSKDK